MKEKNLIKSAARTTANVLTNYLKVDANSTSCFVVYQPRAPKELSRFRRNK